MKYDCINNNKKYEIIILQRYIEIIIHIEVVESLKQFNNSN